MGLKGMMLGSTFSHFSKVRVRAGLGGKGRGGGFERPVKIIRNTLQITNLHPCEGPITEISFEKPLFSLGELGL